MSKYNEGVLDIILVQCFLGYVGFSPENVGRPVRYNLHCTVYSCVEIFSPNEKKWKIDDLPQLERIELPSPAEKSGAFYLIGKFYNDAAVGYNTGSGHWWPVMSWSRY